MGNLELYIYHFIIINKFPPFDNNILYTHFISYISAIDRRYFDIVHLWIKIKILNAVC